jgi:phospholipase A1
VTPLVGTVALLFFSATGTTLAADAAAGLARCAEIGDDDARLRCFDMLAARSAGVTTAALKPRSATETTHGGTTRTDHGAAATAASADPQRQARRSLGILPYRKNYALPVTYNDNVNRNLAQEPSIELPLLGEDVFDNVEMKFQISFEVPLWTRILNRNLDVYFAYTQLAFFQAYNREYSSPFRETNYEPELGLHWQPNLRIGPRASRWRLASMRVAADHQSNGRSEPLSRSWNRITAETSVERGDLSLALRLWAQLDSNPPDNPDIEDYLGFGELRAGYALGRHRLGLMLRSLEHPTVQLDWSYPLGDRVRIYAQYFNGYGESLIDYDHSVNRVGVGFLLEDGG